MVALNLEPYKILVVDDNPVNVKILTVMLQKCRFQVTSAICGKEALALAQEQKPDLIMLDIMMPDMDGYEVCQQLKANQPTQKIPVIFLSALNEAIDKVKAFQIGAADYVVKPFQSEEVVARIEHQLKIHQLQKELERKQKDLEQQNDELARKNDELNRSQAALMRAHRQVDQVFSAFTDILPGTVLDEKYRLESKIGVGGFGIVYRAIQLGLDRPVAVKIFRPANIDDSPIKREQELERFRLEGISACRIQHPNAVSILDFGISSAGIPYLVMELLRGHTLTEEIQEKGRLSPARCAEILIPVCNLLTKAHEMGLIHRDIKPDNIFLHQTEAGEVVKVVDFGIAKLLGESPDMDIHRLTITGSFVGTPVYMSPERLRDAPYDGRSDVYSLGITMYQMLTGQLPFHSNEKDLCVLITLHLTKIPQSLRVLNPEIPPALDDLILRMLMKSPDMRPTACDVMQELFNFIGKPQVSGSHPMGSLPAYLEAAIPTLSVEKPSKADHSNENVITKAGS